ncbi:MAG: hypothetical protein HQ583_04435 [Candidatus Abyssubacteria bacterium]|nr:hypothetical protein [Candidatus Abyssubacteria bacterium]
MSHEGIAKKILASPKPLLAGKTKPTAVHFELVDTPASAKTSEPPKKTNLISDKNTRAQDKFKSEEKLEDSPHMESKHEESKDTRPRAVVRKPPKPPKTALETPPEKSSQAPDSSRASDEAKKEPLKLPEKPEKEARSKPVPEPKKQLPPRAALTQTLHPVPTREKKPATPAEEKRTAPEPKKKEVVRLAKKAPAQREEPAAPAILPRITSPASARNTGADAQITGELSFGATRHFFGEYLLKVKQAVEAQWLSRLVSQYTSVTRAQAVIDFKIQPDGRVTDVDVSSFEGDLFFTLLCLSSIRDAQPFDTIPVDEIPGLPEDFRNKPLNIRFTFRYK